MVGIPERLYNTLFKLNSAPETQLVPSFVYRRRIVNEIKIQIVNLNFAVFFIKIKCAGYCIYWHSLSVSPTNSAFPKINLKTHHTVTEFPEYCRYPEIVTILRSNHLSCKFYVFIEIKIKILN